jgi:hypothetical protein
VGLMLGCRKRVAVDMAEGGSGSIVREVHGVSITELDGQQVD